MQLERANPSVSKKTLALQKIAACAGISGSRTHLCRRDRRTKRWPAGHTLQRLPQPSSCRKLQREQCSIFDTFGIRTRTQSNSKKTANVQPRGPPPQQGAPPPGDRAFTKRPKDDEAFVVAKLDASKNLEKRLDDARRCVYEYSLALHALSDKSASLATALAALSDDAHGDAQQALNELQTHEIKLRRTHAPAALHALQELVGAPLDGAAAGSKDVERLTKARRDKLLDCDSFAARGDERLEAARRDLQHLTASCEAAFVAFSEAVGDATARCAGALSGVVAHFHCGVADAACAM